MKRIKVESSSIESIGYDNSIKGKMTLEVEFKRGVIYHYYWVPNDKICDLIFADSVGKYFDKNIKNVYEFEKASE